MWVTSANAGLMAGAWYYRGDDGPFYLNGVRTQIAMVSVGVVFAVIQEGIYTCHNRRVAWRKHVSAQDEDAEIYVP
ncbi:hypothetical protein VTK73DRAFT_8056 [Phialemonium thermophilum]|uniref:Uncharacterized protein n=1 Tax=Phialemonium thermophilum TaxID=223376 RepID=A0ABR3XQ38_9PEZI